MSTHDHAISPLPLHIEPLPWEDLYSFLSRSAKHMHYESVAWLLHPETSPYHIAPAEISLLTEQADYRFLSQLLSIDEEALYHMTLHQFAGVFQPLHFFLTFKKGLWRAEQYLQPATTPYHAPIDHPRLEKKLRHLFFLANQTTQICPLCLEEPTAYDRLYWKTRYLLTCPVHAVLLQRSCSACQRRIPSLRLRPTHCPSCGRRYCDTSLMRVLPSPDMACLPYGDLLTLHALGVTEAPLQPSFAPAPHDPRETFSAGQYFALLRAICLSLRPFQTAHLRTFLPPAFYDFLITHKFTHTEHVPPLHVAIAHWIFTDWPSHFFAFLDALEYHFGHGKKKHAFYYFPERFLLGSKATEAHDLLSQAYKQHQATSSFQALQRRVRERLAAFDTPTAPLP
jgi:hypothetical protein